MAVESRYCDREKISHVSLWHSRLVCCAKPVCRLATMIPGFTLVLAPLLQGEMNVALNYSNNIPFREKNNFTNGVSSITTTRHSGSRWPVPNLCPVNLFHIFSGSRCAVHQYPNHLPQVIRHLHHK